MPAKIRELDDEDDNYELYQYGSSNRLDSIIDSDEFDDEEKIVQIVPSRKAAKLNINKGQGARLINGQDKEITQFSDNGIDSSNRTIEDRYTKMEQHEHILARPDMYIGSTRRITEELWVWDEENGMMNRQVIYSPGLYKIFDEVLVNAADNYQRDNKMRFIKITVDREAGMVSVHNDGDGIPVEIHKKHKKYVPELIFGDLLTGSSFDDTEDKVTGGRNGLGAKLANIYSKKFIVETACRGKEFKQIYQNNMMKRQPPVLTSTKSKDYTKISFWPDLKRFDGMEEIDDDIMVLFKKRVVDIAGCNSKLNVYLNDNLIPIKTFKDYVALYFKNLPDEKKPEVIGPDIVVDTEGRRRWEVAFAISEGDFQQVSFVNSIWTIRGGNHVNTIVKKISDQLLPKIQRKNRGTEVKLSMIRNHMFIFINALINNPEFDSQTKETLKSTSSQWGTKPDLSDSFYTRIATKSGIIEQILLWNQGRSVKVLKTTSTKKKGRLGISKLTEANNAATNKSERCTLIITEGDSAKGLALAGLSVVGRDNYGIFPLRGKLLNVRDAPMSQVVKNEELNMIKQAMGLQHDKEYGDVSSLRYGRLMIMTDQDHDGSHIKGLFINFIHHYWPSLLRISGFLTEFVTPIVKVSKGDLIISFFTMPEYLSWCQANSTRGWTIKYYKGLGTSEPSEMQEYFSDLPKHKKIFYYGGPEDDHSITLAFAKANADQRKEWLANYQPGTYLDQSLTEIQYNEFINKEFILFSLEDCERSIANMVDGFKPGQRKIMFACFKRNLKGEIKIAQLTGYVLEHCAYHHGETSLYSTIVGMAQNFLGSNNLNLLEPVGNFGSRDQGGKDSAAARYIFTTLSPLTRYVFHPDDDEVLNYLEEEGLTIQPSWYCPVVPMLLINGNAGIGTGWSSFVPNYNPSDVLANIRNLLRNKDTFPMKPWYRGFRGVIEWNEKKNHYTVKGKWRRLDNESIEIIELPIGMWTQVYKDFLEGIVIACEEQEKKSKIENKKKAKGKYDDEADEFLRNDNTNKKGVNGRASKKSADEDNDNASVPGINIKDFKEYHTTTQVHFVVYSPDFQYMPDDVIEKKLKLTSSISVSNMHLFDSEGRIKKYPSPEDILKDFFVLRLKVYQMRKDYIIERIGQELLLLSNKQRFILEVVNKKLVVSGRKKLDLFKDLRSRGYDPIKSDALKKKFVQLDVEILPQGDEKNLEDDLNERDDLESENGGNKADKEMNDAGSQDYNYLLSMPIWSLTYERVQKLMEQFKEKEQELENMKLVHPADLWERDLDAFEDVWKRYEHNMYILDEAGVGGSAFRKPSLQAAASGTAEARRRRQAILATFKNLQKCKPNNATQTRPNPCPDRPDIILPIVKTEPVVPVKYKKEEPSYKLAKGDIQNGIGSKIDPYSSFQPNLLDYIKQEPTMRDANLTNTSIYNEENCLLATKKEGVKIKTEDMMSEKDRKPPYLESKQTIKPDNAKGSCNNFEELSHVGNMVSKKTDLFAMSLSERMALRQSMISEQTQPLGNVNKPKSSLNIHHFDVEPNNKKRLLNKNSFGLDSSSPSTSISGSKSVLLDDYFTKETNSKRNKMFQESPSSNDDEFVFIDDALSNSNPKVTSSKQLQSRQLNSSTTTAKKQAIKESLNESVRRRNTSNVTKRREVNYIEENEGYVEDENQNKGGKLSIPKRKPQSVTSRSTTKGIKSQRTLKNKVISDSEDEPSFDESHEESSSVSLSLSKSDVSSEDGDVQYKLRGRQTRPKSARKQVIDESDDYSD